MKNIDVVNQFCTKLDTCEHIATLRSLTWKTEYAWNKALYDRCSKCDDFTPAGDTNEKEI